MTSEAPTDRASPMAKRDALSDDHCHCRSVDRELLVAESSRLGIFTVELPHFMQSLRRDRIAKHHTHHIRSYFART
jgi:hypothetical protein